MTEVGRISVVLQLVDNMTPALQQAKGELDGLKQANKEVAAQARESVGQYSGAAQAVKASSSGAAQAVKASSSGAAKAVAEDVADSRAKLRALEEDLAKVKDPTTVNVSRQVSESVRQTVTTAHLVGEAPTAGAPTPSATIAATQAQKDLRDSTTAANVAVDKQTLKFVAQVTAVQAVYRGLNMLNSSMTTLGIISADDAKKFDQLNAAVGLVVGTFQMFKGIVYIVSMMRDAEVALAAVETYRSVINSKGAMAAVAAIGIGTAAGVVGYFAGASSQSSTTNVNQTVNFGGQANVSQRQTAYETLDLLGG